MTNPNLYCDEAAELSDDDSQQPPSEDDEDDEDDEDNDMDGFIDDAEEGSHVDALANVGVKPKVFDDSDGSQAMNDSEPDEDEAEEGEDMDNSDPDEKEAEEGDDMDMDESVRSDYNDDDDDQPPQPEDDDFDGLFDIDEDDSKYDCQV